MKLKLIIGAAAVALTSVTGSVASAASIDLGFALDESGSVSTSDFNLSKQGLANALGKIPTSGANQYRISVVAFNSTARTIISPTVVTAGNLASLQSTVSNVTKFSGGTDIAESIDLLRTNFVDAGLGDESYLNVSTDGGSSVTAIVTAAENAQAAGIDGLSFEAIGRGANTDRLLRACFGNNSYTDPGANNVAAGCSLVSNENNLPDATQEGFVLEVDDFLDFENAITAKVESIVRDTGGGGNGTSVVPLPAAAWMLLAGVGALGFTGRRKKA
jgi:hypothetical protein